jgi:hypothetical protein
MCKHIAHGEITNVQKCVLLGSVIGGELHDLMSYVLCRYRGGFPHAPRPYMVYSTSPIDIQTAAMRTHRASPLVPPTREQRN